MVEEEVQWDPSSIVVDAVQQYRVWRSMGNQISDIAGIRKQANGTRWQPASLDASGAMDGWCEHAACTQPPAASFDWNWSPAGAMCSSADDQGARQRGEFCSTGQAPSHRGVQVEDVSAGQLGECKCELCWLRLP
jgi:hypothetical protein